MTISLLLLAASLSVAQTGSPAASSPDAFEKRRVTLTASIRDWFMDETGQVDPPDLVFAPADEAMFPAQVDALRSLRDQAAFLRAGRVDGWDDWAAYADMTVLVAVRLGVEPPESAIPVYRGRLRPLADDLTPYEESVREELATAIRDPQFAKRYLYIADLVGYPNPPNRPPLITVKTRKGRRRITKVVQAKAGEYAPPPRVVSLIDRVDWEKAGELAEVAEDNARNWDQKDGESNRKYRRRLARLRKHCYEWVRRDLTALGFWDPNIFRNNIPTRGDRKRPIRAASFALAMAKIEAAAEKKEPLGEKTSLRQLNLRVDPIVRGAIIVFGTSVCGMDPRNGHIEIVTSLDPLRAASYKFHTVTTECLVRASNENKVHVYVPLKQEQRQTGVAQPVTWRL